ncbi:macro domain-containing protein [Levilactobacillus angrenensis]|uniref:Macro domain-containing protein n=1 Tax=Levilactobacillus angrenensis TaxID=2486020 RepID=A0ABW1U9N9_9LACO|nr:macro domain-containing protein [Levilactobacillus angrenensis]
MLIYLKTSLFDSPAQVLVNTVNTVGVMGKGIALDFKRLYPNMFTEYRKLCEAQVLTIGKLWLYKTDNKWILNFPTKKDWRNKSKLAYIEVGLQKFVATYRAKKIKTIAFPQLGVGNGGLDWESEVKPLMEKYLQPLPIKVYIHLYDKKIATPEFINPGSMKKWLEKEPAVLSVGEFKTELKQQLSLENLNAFHGHRIELLDEQPTSKLDDTAVVFMTIEGSPKGKYALSQADISDFWTRLRRQGVIVPVELPQELHNHDDEELFKLLVSTLPYIKILPAALRGKSVSLITLNQSQLPVLTVNKPDENSKMISGGR